MSLTTEAETILAGARQQLEAGASQAKLRKELLGSEGRFGLLMKRLGSLVPEERGTIGKQLNEIRQSLISLLEPAETREAAAIVVDPTAPEANLHFGSVHPISATIEHMTDIFSRLSFEAVEGPEVVSDEENFELLNMGSDHPARNDQDTFYLTDTTLLRTQTTAVQVLEMRQRMKDKRLPIRVVVPGKTYRREADATHAAMFHQFEGIMVDNQTTFADLKGCLDYFCKELFGDQVETRFRPHHFPYTEPSAEIDIRWKGRGESGKHTEWLEMGGCGMIHPEVLKRAGINPRIYQGWAFGMGIERVVMVKYGVSDVRRLTENALPFLTQFAQPL